MLRVHEGREFMQLEPPEYLYLVEPLIPHGGTILLYGKYGVGKSPFTWHIANAVATGMPFLGMHTNRANVAYIDVDTPWHMIQKRWKEVDFSPGFVIIEGQAFDCLRFGSNVESYKQPYEALRQCRRQYDPRLVVVNTLMKVHETLGKNPNVPKEVYARWQELFPDAALVFVHHDKKDVVNNEGLTEQQEDEQFSGYQEWINHCNVAIHLLKQPNDNFLLKQTKDQGSGKIDPILIHLRDGFFLEPVTVHYRSKVAEIKVSNPSLSKDELIKRVAGTLGIPLNQAKRLVEDGH